MSKYLLVRSPSSLVNDGLAGYGWPEIDFTGASNFDELMACFKKEQKSVGRRTKAIRRFFNIKKYDVVIVPLKRSFALGISTGGKSFDSGIKHGANQVVLEYLKDQQGQVIKIPRKEVSEALSTRLKVRLAVADISEFKDEIDLLIKQIQENGSVSFSSRVDELEVDSIDRFKTQLLSNVRSGKTNLESGGWGLEKLVLELLKIEGYAGRIPAKTERQGIADVDIDAYTDDRFKVAKLHVQVKHHKGNTNKHGLKQLIAVDDSDAEKWLITSGDLSEEVRGYAEEYKIKVMSGVDLVSWIYSKQAQLSPTARQKLGISAVPTLLL